MKKLLARYPIGNPRRKWKQDNFILSLFNPEPMGLDKAGPKQCEIARHGVQTAVDAGVLPVDVSISELKDAYGNDYLVVANRNCQKAVRFSLTAKKPMRAWRVSDEDGEQYLAFDDARNSIISILQPGCAVLYRLQPKEEEPYAVEYYLEKGEAK